ncbi:hypothetical protein Tco_1297043 [Tanacetum coccineum]
MANLEFSDKHNMVAYLKKSDRSEGFHEIIDFLSASHIYYAPIENPTIYVSFIKQFWSTAATSTRDNGEQLALMGYATDSEKLTFQKGKFSPKWRFLIHPILHCISPKKTSWEQFSSNIATAIICLATNRTYNFSKMIFDAMVKNIDSPHKFLMYPRFIQIYLNKQKRQLQPHTRTHAVHSLTNKVFSNMKRLSRGYHKVEVPLFPTMINPSLPSSSTSRITSSSDTSLSPPT